MEVGIVCPECNKETLIKFGKKFIKEGDVRILKQQYQCKNCGRITVKPIKTGGING